MWMEKLMDRLDVDQPTWAFDWASQEDLRQYAFDLQSRYDAMKGLRERIAYRLFHRILHAGLGAGIIKEA